MIKRPAQPTADRDNWSHIISSTITANQHQQQLYSNVICDGFCSFIIHYKKHLVLNWHICCVLYFCFECFVCSIYVQTFRVSAIDWALRMGFLECHRFLRVHTPALSESPLLNPPISWSWLYDSQLGQGLSLWVCLFFPCSCGFPSGSLVSPTIKKHVHVRSVSSQYP